MKLSQIVCEQFNGRSMTKYLVSPQNDDALKKLEAIEEAMVVEHDDIASGHAKLFPALDFHNGVDDHGDD